MPSEPLAEFEHYLDERLRRLWPLTALLADKLDGRLMGGTALALHLRHRVSEDLDIMTFKTFSGRQLAKRMKRHIADAYGNTADFDIHIQTAEEDGYFALLDGVKVDVFRARPSESTTADVMRWLAPPVNVEGVPVGSVPDILVSKLDVIMYRPRIRDYIDLASIDRLTSHGLELGIAYYKLKYRYDLYPRPRVIRRIIDLIENPGRLLRDDRFEDLHENTLAYLARRAPEVRRYVEQADDKHMDGGGTDPWRYGPDSTPSLSGSSSPSAVCGKWMPRARKRCVLSLGHAGGCRARHR